MDSIGTSENREVIKEKFLKRIVNLKNDGHVFTYNTLFVSKRGSPWYLRRNI